MATKQGERFALAKAFCALRGPALEPLLGRDPWLQRHSEAGPSYHSEAGLSYTAGRHPEARSSYTCSEERHPEWLQRHPEAGSSHYSGVSYTPEAGSSYTPAGRQLAQNPGDHQESARI